MDGCPIQSTHGGHGTFPHDGYAQPANGLLQGVEEWPDLLDVIAHVRDEPDIGPHPVEDDRVRRPASRWPATLDDGQVVDAGRRHARSEGVQHGG